MKVHKFRCENEHEFFLPLVLLEDANALVDMLNNMTCPLCKSKRMNIDPNIKEIV